MSDLPLISVIVPVYGVEKYLDQCVQSIVDQTYSNLEIILVDDGSPDNCGAMCDVWAEKDSRICVIHKTNGGLSDARNAGMLAAKGELIGFVDSDDWIDPEMYRELYGRMCSDNSDISSCGVLMFWEDGRADEMLTMPGDMLLESGDAMKAIIEQTWIKQPVWNKLYKREFISDLSFLVGKCNEDAFWSYQAIGRASRVSVGSAARYHYRQRNNSIMGKRYSLKRLDGLEAQKRQLEYVNTAYPELFDIAKANMLFACMYAMEMSMQHLSGEDWQQAYHRIHSYVKEILPVRLSGACGLKNNVWIALAQIWFDGVCRLQIFLENRSRNR